MQYVKMSCTDRKLTNHSDLGGRPKSEGVTNEELHHGKPYGMGLEEDSDIVEFLESTQACPIYPKAISGGSVRSKNKEAKAIALRNKSRRKDFKKKCQHYTAEDGVLFRLVTFQTFRKKSVNGTDGGTTYKARVAKRGEVTHKLFEQFHNEKGHIG